MGIPDEVPRPEDRAGEAQIALAGDSPPACLVPAGLPVLRLWQSNPSRLVEQTPENLKRKAGREMDSVAGSKAGRESQGENQMTHTLLSTEVDSRLPRILEATLVPTAKSSTTGVSETLMCSSQPAW